MSAARRLRASQRRLARRFGEWVAVDFLRPHTLSTAGGKVPSVLRLAIAATAGTSDITLHSANQVGGVWIEEPLEGAVWAGLRLELSGSEHFVSADAVVAGDRLEIAVSPSLAGPAALEDPVSVDAAARATAHASVRDIRIDELSGELLGDRGLQLSIPADRVPWPPRLGQQVEIPSKGFRGRVASVESSSVSHEIQVVSA